MLDLGWSELLVIAVVAIVVIGPKDLPRVMRLVGQWTGRMKRMARDFQNQFNEALKEAELDDVQKDIQKSADEIRKIGSDMDRQMAKSEAEVKSGLARATETPAIPAPGAPPGPPAPVEAKPPVPTPAPVEPVSPPAPPETSPAVATGAAGDAKP